MDSSKILITGVAGTGKSTVLQELQKRNFSGLGIDETPGLSYWVNKQHGFQIVERADFTEEFLAEHDWICDVDLVEAILTNSSKPVFLCGSADNIEHCMKLCDMVFLLQCPVEVSLERIISRVGNKYGKSEAAQAALRSYQQVYNEQCLALGAISIDATQPVEKVVEDMLAHIS